MKQSFEDQKRYFEICAQLTIATNRLNNLRRAQREGKATQDEVNTAERACKRLENYKHQPYKP